MKAQVAIIGGGISGLSFAHYCSLYGLKSVVFEKNKIPGGCIESFPLSSHYFAELGGHTLTYKYKTVQEIIHHYHGRDKLISKPNLKFELVEKRNIYSIIRRLDFFDLFRSLPNIRKISKEGKSVEEYYAGVLGSKNYRSLLHYAFQAILCQNPDRYPAEMLFRKRSPNKAYPRNFTLQEGIINLLKMILSNQAIEFKPDTQITKVSLNEKGFYGLWSGDTLLLESRYLNLSCPPDVAGNLLREAEPDLASVLRTIETTEVETILITSDNQEALRKRKKSFIGIDSSFYSAIFHEVDGKKFWVFHFGSQICNLEEKKKVIADVFNVQSREIKVLHEKRSKLPAITVDDKRKIEFIKKLIERKPLFLATNYIEGLAIEDCCVRAKSEAERLKSLL